MPPSTPPQTFPALLGLPPELRNRIYELVVVAPYSIDLFGLETSVADTWAISSAIQQPPLTRTCHQIRVEALPLFYSGNTFEVFAFGNGSAFFRDLAIIIRWCVKIGPANRRAMGRVIICTRGNEDVLRKSLHCMENRPETLGWRWRWEGEVEESDERVGGWCVANEKYGESLTHYAVRMDA